jgi:hypothetical protein
LKLLLLGHLAGAGRGDGEFSLGLFLNRREACHEVHVDGWVLEHSETIAFVLEHEGSFSHFVYVEVTLSEGVGSGLDQGVCFFNIKIHMM